MRLPELRHHYAHDADQGAGLLEAGVLLEAREEVLDAWVERIGVPDAGALLRLGS